MTHDSSDAAAREANGALRRVGEALKARFVSERRVLSFGEYLDLVRATPYRHTRDAARYLRDCFDAFGTTTVRRADGEEVTRHRLFDLPFLDPVRAREALVGHEEIQASFYRAVSNFVREGRINRLVLLHGPNGSAKSTFVNCMIRALEHYSSTDDGALYYFSWIFPRGKDGRPLGFGSTGADEVGARAESYAHLPDAAIDLRLDSELRESPLLLLPAEDRRAIVEGAYRDASERREPAPRLVMEGELGAKNRMIFDALMTAYRGDLARVLAHVRVERLTISQRYRRGAVTIGPQMAVDAVERQITMDRSLAALPASLSSVSLYETHGDLVDATGGILEFSDLLKRPLDAWRYLLLAVEEGEVALQASVLPLNVVFVATSNDLHLKAFREHHEYRSFRGRLSLVRVPYLVDYRAEQAIYDTQVVAQLGRPPTPHATYVAALWAVLTRLVRPQGERYERAEPGSVGALAPTLTPIEKAELYADGLVPDRFTNEEAAELRAHVADIRHEADSSFAYEGSSGASPREIRTLLLDAAQDPAHDELSPIAVLSRIEELCDGEDYEFLRDPVDGAYRDPRGFVAVVEKRWLDRVDRELRAATGLVDEARYGELFERYVTHVSFALKGEKIPNPVTGRDEDPDVALMRSVEEMLGVGERSEDHRRNLISTIAAFAIDHPGERPAVARVFPRQLDQLREANWISRKRQLAEIVGDVLRLSSAEPIADAAREERARTTRDAMIARFGYSPSGVRDVLATLLARRYA